MSTSKSMPDHVAEHLMEMAQESPSREICGFVMQRWALHPIRNVSEDDYAFDMDPQQQLDIFVERKSEIIGMYHSHPSGSEYPSDRDIYGAPYGIRYWIVTATSVTEWVIKDGTATTTVAAAVHPAPEAV